MTKIMKKITKRRKLQKIAGMFGMAEKPLYYTQHALEKLKMIGTVTEEMIKNILKNTWPIQVEEAGDQRLKFEKDNIVIMTALDRSNGTTIITVYKKQIIMSLTALNGANRLGITQLDVENIIKSIKPSRAEEGMDGDARWLFKTQKVEVITNDTKSIVISVQGTGLTFSSIAQRVIDNEGLSKAKIENIIKSVEPVYANDSMGGSSSEQQLNYTKDDISVITDANSLYVFAIHKIKLHFTYTAKKIMEQENITEQTVNNILKSVEPIDAFPGSDGEPRRAFTRGKYSIITNYNVTTVISIKVKPDERSSQYYNIKDNTDESSKYCKIVPGSKPDSYRSSISQPYSTHEVLDREGSRIYNAYNYNEYAVDCARCAAAYAGFGQGTQALTQLQKHSVENNGTSFANFDQWLYDNSSTPESTPQLYALRASYLRKYDGCISAAARDFANILLNENEQVLAVFVKNYSTGHYFNIAKQSRSIDPQQRVWYVDPQVFQGPGIYTIAQSLAYKTRQNRHDPILNVLFVLIPEQARWFSDYVVEANYGNPRKGWWTKND